MNCFENKRMLITGASSGIGEALAYEFAKMGAKLILAARSQTELERVRNQCLNPTVHHIMVINLEDIHRLEDQAATLWDSHGPVDILIHNAGLSQRYLAYEGSWTVDQKIMAVNFMGVIALTRPLMQRMLQRRQGHIVCVSSILGLIGKKNRTMYSASKHALRGYFESLRYELWRTPIKLTMIYPGHVNTHMSKKALVFNGDPYGKVESTHASGLDVNLCARRIVQAIQAQKTEAIIARPVERGAVWMARFMPAIFRKIFQRVSEGSP